MKTRIENKKKWQELIQRWHNPQLQEGLGFLFDDMTLLQRDMSVSHRIVMSSIIHFVQKLYSKAYSDNFYEYLHDKFVWKQTEILNSVATHEYNLKRASLIKEIKGKLPEEFYWKDDDRSLTYDRAEKLIGFLERAHDTNSEEYKVLKTSTYNTIDKEIQKKSGNRDWEDEYIKEFPYHF